MTKIDNDLKVKWPVFAQHKPSIQEDGMSQSNGVIRVGRKGIKKFAFGEDGEPFEVDVVVAFQQWINTDARFRGEDGEQRIRNEDMPAYHQAAVEYVKELSNGQEVTTAEALDFIARLREQYDELVDFFQPKLRPRPGSQDTSEEPSPVLFSAEEN